jgi:hypothetical protein
VLGRGVLVQKNILNNRYHRHLNLTENYVPIIDFSQWNVDGLQWVEFHKDLQLEELNNQKFIDWLHSFGMTSEWIEVFHTPPNEDGIIHSDNIEYHDWAKIVFQYGANGSTMRWWKSEFVKEISTSLEEYHDQYDTSYRNDGHYHGQVLVSSPEYSELVYESKIGTASLVNVGPLHSSHNPTNEGRFVVTVALFDFNANRILWDDALHRLSTYIAE